MRRHDPSGDAHVVHAALAALGRRGRTSRIPEAVRTQVLAYARRQRAAGETWQQIARAVGVSAASLHNWSRTPRRARRLVPVAVSAPEASTPALVLVSPAGYRVEGLDLATASALLRALG